uniref:Ionotropic glutamate receptor L-glutamate and glycine-binding domain-containing protein n=2 Tax=Anopheles coluzzii TaxID=1518534 RepID=A0A6E8WBA3_ANOCL
MFRKTVIISFAILALLSIRAQADRQEQVIDYLSNITHNLQIQHSGVYNCWLLHFSNKSVLSPMLDNIAQRLNNQDVSLLQSNHRGQHVRIFREPNLVIILWGNQQQTFDNFYTSQWIVNIPPECPTIVLFELDETETDQPRKIGDYFQTRSVLYFALIAINKDAVYCFHYQPLRITSHSGLPTLDQLFFDRLQTMQFKTLVAGYVKDYYTSIYCEKLPGEDIRLFLLFAETQQLTFHLQQLRCNSNESLAQCLSRYNPIHLMLNRFFMAQYDKFAVSGVAMEQFAIATPKGRLLTVWEIMIKPFQHSVWGMILGILVAYQIIHQLKPTLFSNNLLALALFGFDKRQLVLSKSFEKITACALIVLFFQLKCAYEAKLVSYITEAPRVPDAKSVEDLRERNITVHYRNFNITLVHKLDGMVQFYGKNQFEFDGITIVENRAALITEKLFADNMDGYGMQYTLLSENVYDAIPFYVFGAKSLLVRRFHNFQQRVFEAGMQQRWRREYYNCFLWYIIRDRLKYTHHSERTYDGSSIIISYNHLKPLMLFFFVQWTLEVMVFGIELLVGILERSQIGVI